MPIFSDQIGAIQILERTPRLLDTLLRDLDDTWVRSNEGGDSWSPFDVVGHLICGELYDWMPRLRIVMDDPGRTFEPFDRFAQEREFGAMAMHELLDRFADERANNLDDLSALDLQPNDLARTGLHPEFGEVTVAQLLHTWVVHDLGHIAQISRALAKYYIAEVGPWAAYLPVLHRK